MEPTLHQALAAVGWSSRPAAPGVRGRVIVDEHGQVVGEHSADGTWRLLRERGLHPEQRAGAATPP